MLDFSDMGWIEFQNHVRQQARERGVPVFGTFELTPLCNFACKMCYVRLAPDEMRERGRLRTAAEWLDMARQAREAGTIGITLTGGEVLTRPDFAEIYTGIVDEGLVLSILSNGSLVDEDAVALFSERPPAHMRFTLYGAANGTYERLCGAADGFDRVMRGLRLLKRAGIGFSLSFTETRLNIGDFDAVRRIAEELDVRIVFGTELVPGVRGARNDADGLRVETPRVAPVDRARAAREAREPEGQAPRPPARHPFARCRSYRNSFWIDWNGDMEACSFMSSCRARPFEDGFSAAWRQLLVYEEGIRLPDGCAACPDWRLCSACPGVLEAETGSPERICPRVCDRAHDLARRIAADSGPEAAEGEVADAIGDGSRCG